MQNVFSKLKKKLKSIAEQEEHIAWKSPVMKAIPLRFKVFRFGDRRNAKWNRFFSKDPAQGLRFA